MAFHLLLSAPSRLCRSSLTASATVHARRCRRFLSANGSDGGAARGSSAGGGGSGGVVADRITNGAVNLNDADVVPCVVRSINDEASSVLSRLDDLEARVHDMERFQRPSFRAGQYNILASYLGNNREPWFLFDGLTRSEDDMIRADLIAKKHRERDENGRYKNVGWPNYVRGILTEEEQDRVVKRDRATFAWNVRAPRIVRAIRSLDADVLSLVELDQYEEFFRDEIDGLGMDSVWIKRPRKSSLDGCAVCWKRSKFEHVAHKAFHYCDDADGGRRDRVALFALLRMKNSPEEPRLIFVSTHLARNPECKEQGAIRLRQAAQLMVQLKEFADENGCDDTVPVVVAGDWNAESLNEVRSVTAALFGLQDLNTAHPLLWGSLDVPTRRTSYTLLRQSRIDYLMYSDNRLMLRDVKHVELDGDDRLIPDKDHPSDHLPITADFQYPTELEVAQECARRFCASILSEKTTMRRPLLPDELRTAFRYFDYDDSGSISDEEFQDSTHSLGVADSIEDVRRLQDACVENGEATYKSFKRAFEESFAKKRRNVDEHGKDDPFLADVIRAFNYFDLDGNGSLSHEEISSTLRAISPTAIDDETIDRILKTIDLNNDGDVQLDEFVAAMIKSQLA